MANTKSALKELRKTKKRSVHNYSVKTNFKHLFRDCTDLIEAGDMENAKAKYIEFQKSADKAAKCHIISKNRANRRKAALMEMLSGKREVPAGKRKGRSKPKAVKKVETAPTPAPAPEAPVEAKQEEEPKNEA
jgi:small subunit ribosomal protein S20